MDSRHVSSTVMREARKTASYTVMKNLLVKIFELVEKPSFRKLRVKESVKSISARRICLGSLKRPCLGFPSLLSLYLCPAIMLLVFTLSLTIISLTVNLWWLDSWASLIYGKMIASARTCIAAGSISIKASLVHKSLTTILSTCLK
ncbi:unnamed protein product [Rhizopus stolonifer]